MIERFGRTLPFGGQRVFDTTADIERYPEFLRCWISADSTARVQHPGAEEVRSLDAVSTLLNAQRSVILVTPAQATIIAGVSFPANE